MKLELNQSGSFHPASQSKIGAHLQPSGCCTGCSHLPPQKQKSNRLAMRGGGSEKWQGRGNLRETRSTSTATPAISKSTFPRQQRHKNLSILQRDYIHRYQVLRGPHYLIEQHNKGLCCILSPRSLRYPPHQLSGVGSTDFIVNHTLEPFSRSWILCNMSLRHVSQI